MASTTSHVLLLVLGLLAAFAAAEVIFCTNEHDCPDHIKCIDGEDCIVECSGEESCQEKSIACPTNNACNITCSGEDSCEQNKFILGSGPSASFNLTCNHEEACEEAGIAGDCDKSDCVITCDGDKACKDLFCVGSGCPSGAVAVDVTRVDDGNTIKCHTHGDCPDHIKCPAGADCHVECDGFQSCQQRTIECPDNNACSISCYDAESCQQVNFDRNSASTFNLTCDGWDACEESKIAGRCDSPNCHVHCSGGEACKRLYCVGDDCPK